MLRIRAAAVTAALAVGLSGVTAAPTATAARGNGGSTPTTGTTSTKPCGGERPVKPTGGRYTCTFEDNFDGSSLDMKKWMYQETWFSGMTSGNNDCFVKDPDNVSVSGGQVHITARVEPEPFVCKSPFGDFTTSTTAGTIATRGNFAQAYGRFEFRAKFPNATVAGLQSALWLYPAKHTYGGWPDSGEIDVAEWFSGDAGKVYPSVHYRGEDPKLSTGYNCPVPTAGTEFHRYAVEWTPTVMRFLYDGALCFQHSWTPAAPLVAPQPFDQPFYLVLTQVFGGAWNAVTSETPKVATTDVDWVRVWN